MADVSKMETMTGVPFHGVDCVIHAAAATGFADFPAKSVMELVNVGGERHGARLANPVKLDTSSGGPNAAALVGSPTLLWTIFPSLSLKLTFFD